MGRPFRSAATLILGVVMTLGLGALAARPAHADGARSGRGADNVVFVQTNDPAGNSVIAYARDDDGSLAMANSYATGGAGAVLGGATSDTLASQGSLVYDDRSGVLIAVNAGSDTVTVFRVRGNELTRSQVVASGGTFPVSVTIHRNLVYVLNARDGGSVAGFRFTGHRLRPIRGLRPAARPRFRRSTRGPDHSGPSRVHSRRRPGPGDHEGQRT